MKEFGQNSTKKIFDYIDKNWSEKLQLDQEIVNLVMELYLDNINSILDTYTPFKRVIKYKLRVTTKSWTTPALQISISVNNNSLPKNSLIVMTLQERNIDILSIRNTEIFYQPLKRIITTTFLIVTGITLIIHWTVLRLY